MTRNLIISSIPLILFLARSLTLSPRLVRVAVLIVLVAMSSTSYYQNVLRESKEDFRTATEIVREHANPQDLIVFAPPYLEIPFSYYWDRSPFSEVSVDILTDGVIKGLDVKSETGPIQELIDSHERVWLIMNSDNIYRRDASHMKQVLGSQGRLLQSQQTHGLSIFLYRILKK